MDSTFNSEFDVDVLSASFNMDKADFMGRLFLIDDFTTFDNDRFNIIRENDGKENCAQVLEELLHRMLGIKYVLDEHDCNVVSMNSLNTHDANDMQSHKLGGAMFDEDDMFSPPSFDEQIYYDDSMPPIYDDYIDESGFGRVSTLGINDPTILEGVESYCDNY